jgi:hypothetical protein
MLPEDEQPEQGENNQSDVSFAEGGASPSEALPVSKPVS